MASRRLRTITALSLAAAALFAGFVSLRHVSRSSSPVWDELQFFGLGAYLRHTGRFDVPGAALHPPLSYYLGSLPLGGAPLPLEAFRRVAPGEDPAGLAMADIERGNQLIERWGFARFLSARTPFVLVYCALALLVFAWARYLWGDSGGLFSLALCLLCPNLMAHGFLITTDLLVGTLIMATLYALVRALARPGPGWLGLFVVGFALAPASKLTGLLVGPLAGVMVLVHAVAQPTHDVWIPGRGHRSAGRCGFLLVWAAVGLIALAALYLTLVLVYQGDWALRTYRLDVALVTRIVGRGHRVFLDGRVAAHGFPSYYLFALAYKTSFAVWGAVVLAAALPLSAPRRPLAVCVGLAALVVAYFSLSGHTLGLRFVLVALPLLYVAAGRLAVGALAPDRPARLRLGLCVVIVTSGALELAAVYPYPRAYVNRALVRRPAYTALADMDLDGGEGLLALRRFVDEHRLGAIALSYHGAAWPALFGIHTSFYENPSVGIAADGPVPTTGLFFVSSTNLSGVYFARDRYAWLRGREPRAIIGGTIYAFALDAGAAEASPGRGGARGR